MSVAVTRATKNNCLPGDPVMLDFFSLFYTYRSVVQSVTDKNLKEMNEVRLMYDKYSMLNDVFLFLSCNKLFLY